MGKTRKNLIKKILPITLIMIIMLSLTGCIRMGMGINVHEDETADFAMTIAMNAAMMQGSGSSPTAGEASQGNVSMTEGFDFSEEDQKKLKEAGYEVSDYNDNGYTGFTVIRHNLPFDELNNAFDSLKDLNLEDKEMAEASPSESDTGMTNMLGDGISITKSDDVYTFNVETKKDDSEQSSGMMDSTDTSAMFKSMGGFMQLTLTLPEEPIEHNADKVSEDGKTLTWDLLKTDRKDTSLWATFKLPKKSGINIIKLLVLILVVVLIIGAVIAVLFLVVLPMIKKNGNSSKRERPVKAKQQNNVETHNSVAPAPTRRTEPCKWCSGIEDANIRIQYCGINGKNRIVSYDREKGMVIYGIAEYCPNCGRKINYKEEPEAEETE